MAPLKSFDFSDWNPSVNYDQNEEATHALEEGQVLFFPKLNFQVSEEELALFSPDLVKKDRKNLSYDLSQDVLKGCSKNEADQNILKGFMKRFAQQAQHFVHTCFPSYESHLECARTSFRPVEVLGRDNASFRKDDTLLHLDSFPSTPTGGKRILRFFANVNPHNKPRVWKVGEPCTQVLRRYLPKIKKPFMGSRLLLNRLGITKSYRILYDHYMLNIHNYMKADTQYQKEVTQYTVEFPSLTCWMVFTDQVSHAALSGQYVLEQSFYLPVEAQKNPEKSPLHKMEKLFQQRLRH